MASGDARGGGFYGFLTFIAVAMLVAVVVLSIRTYDRDDEAAPVPVATAGQTAGETPPESPQIATEPVGGVATGGGGTAVDDSGSLVLPVLGGLVVLSLLAVARIVWWPRRGLTPA